MKYGAFGLVEVLGSCNAVMVIDQMLKTADVSFRTWNGKCGGHEVVFMSGDVSAVTAAVESVKQNPPCDIILAAVIVGGTGLFIGVFLGVAGKKFAVEVDEREEAILGVLPGNNCGGCGYAGCSGLAAAIVKGEAEVGGCPVGGAPVAAKVGEIMGVAAGAQVHEVAFVKCGGDCEKAKQEYEYHGLNDCTMVNMMQDGGPKACSYGCLGDGSCVQACPFDAIHIVNGVAVVDKEACKACGKCVAVCPKHLIEIVPYDQKHLVKCNSQDKGKAVMQACTAGCIGCKMCEKACKFEAVTVENNIAHIDYEKCKDCGACAVKCPKKVIS